MSISRCIYIDKDERWWLCKPENGEPVKGVLQVIGEYEPEELPEYESQTYQDYRTYMIGVSPRIFFVDEDGALCLTHATGRWIAFTDKDGNICSAECVK